MERIRVYTRTPTGDYTNSLANSAHFAIGGDGDFVPLNKNYGVLFAEGIIDERNVIVEKGLAKPQLFMVDENTFGITALRVDKDGEIDTLCGERVLFWTTDDFIRFKSHGLVEKNDRRLLKHMAATEAMSDSDILKSENILQSSSKVFHGEQSQDAPKSDFLFGARYSETASDMVSITDEIAEKVRAHYFPEKHISNAATMHGKACQTAASQSLQTDLENVSGCEHKTYGFPLAVGYADPVIFKWKRQYYFIATNDNTNAVGLYARESDTVEGLFDPDVREHVILEYNEEKGFVQTFWAPELHEIAGDIYVLFAVGGKRWSPQSYVMKLKKGGSIVNPNHWEGPIRVKKADGTYLAEEGITLDMTYFCADERHYLSWSYRKGINSPTDTGSMLYIAEIDKNTPHILKSEPVLLSRPLYGWENIQGTINNEGSFPLITENKIYLAYSGGAAGGYTYAIGLLSINRGGNCLNPDEWEKLPHPLLSYYSFPGEFGPGHNSFFLDENGNTMIAYHAQQKMNRAPRCTAIRQVCFRANGEPFVI